MKPIPELTHDLEEMVDQRSLAAVLDLLADICLEKGDHLRCHWQDEASARAWLSAGLRINDLSKRVASL